MLPIVTPEEMSAIDAAASETVEELIERAGRRVARAARQMLGGVYGRRVAVIVGPGNNGADALVAAERLRSHGVRIAVVTPGESIPPCDLVIDGAFGTGLTRRYDAPSAPEGTPVLAVDIPSGIDGLTGEVRGSAMIACRTVTFAALKPGLLLADPELVGDIEIVDIGLHISDSLSWLFTRSDAQRFHIERGRADHKWKRAVLVVGGSQGMVGAPLLASEAALRSGAGIVECVLPGIETPTTRTEVVTVPATSDGWAVEVLQRSSRMHAVVLGPGLGVDAADDVQRTLAELPDDLPVVVDGTALRMLDGLHLRPNVVLTPHDGEYHAFVGSAPGPDRFSAARRASHITGATVLLKGPVTVVASPNGQCRAVTRGDQRLATAGSGDVLAGAIGAFLAAGVTAPDAAALGAWVHGDAAKQGYRIGLIASDLVDGLAHSLSELALTGG